MRGHEPEISGFAVHFVHNTTPRQIRVTPQTRARMCSPDSVECAKIGFKSPDFTHLVFSLVFVRGTGPGKCWNLLICCTFCAQHNSSPNESYTTNKGANVFS